jgi:hypothetical protein
MKTRLCLFVVAVCILMCAGCATNPANPTTLIARPNLAPSGPEKVVRGVVNGVWRYDPASFRNLMAKYTKQLTPEQIDEYSGRYLARVGISRESAAVALFLSFGVGGCNVVDYVVLPAGWTHDIHSVSDDPHVVNVGDVVDVKVRRNMYFGLLEGIARKCNAEPNSGEDKAWNIGCKTFTDYEQKTGFAGDHHYLRCF